MGLGHSPRIVTDGLVLALDAANPKNYNLTAVEVLVVAGGGGGGGRSGGGGGAGGLIYNSNFSVTPGSALTVTVGSSGSGGAGTGNAGSDGGNSVFGSITATGGGGGSGDSPTTGRNGGSGGGGKYGSAGGTGISGQGFAGGTGTSGTWKAGGGGGAGGVGVNGVGSPHKCGNGGPGLGFDISGTFTYYAGGGGGGSHNSDAGGCCDDATARGLGGIGGGGNGGTPGGFNAGDNATANTGGGGGGGSTIGGDGGAGGNGGSGIVIVRYPGPQRAIGGTVTSSGGYTIHTFTTVETTSFTPLAATNDSAILGLSDFSGNNNFGTTANSPTYSGGNGGYITFDGVNEYIDCGNIGNIGNTYTIECFFNSSSVVNYRNVYDMNYLTYAGVSGNVGPRLEQYSNNAAAWYWSGVTNANDPYNSTTQFSLSSNTWYYTAFTMDNGTVNTYVNGNIQNSNVSSTQGYVSTFGSVNLGRGFVLADRHFSGKISNFKIYNRALTASEIQQNFNALRGRFSI